nr:unnamed protein product [Callosobruchus analis]
MAKWKRPFKVFKSLGTDRYEVTDIPGSTRSRVPYSGAYAPEHMKRWTTFDGHEGFPNDSLIRKLKLWINIRNPVVHLDANKAKKEKIRICAIAAVQPPWTFIDNRMVKVQCWAETNCCMLMEI